MASGELAVRRSGTSWDGSSIVGRLLPIGFVAAERIAQPVGFVAVERIARLDSMRAARSSRSLVPAGCGRPGGEVGACCAGCIGRDTGAAADDGGLLASSSH
jgi:hypothetical protein